MHDTLSEDEILARGIIQSVPKVLGDSEWHLPVNHWLNRTGARAYAKTRVELAESLIESSHEGRYYHEAANKLNASPRPFTRALYIVDYTLLLESIQKSLSSSIWTTRISHPFLGRMPGSQQGEQDLIKTAIATIIHFYDSDARVNTWKETDYWLIARAGEAADRLGSPWPDVICREAGLRSNLTRAKSKYAAGKLLDMFSLLHVGQVKASLFQDGPQGLVEILVHSPALRFDRAVIKTAGS